MGYSAERYIPGLGRDFKIHPDHIKAEGGADKHTPGLGRSFFINPAHVK